MSDQAASKAVVTRRRILGIVGGGQLGRMTALAARRLGFDVIILDPESGSPAGQVADAQIIGDLRDPEKLRELAAHCDVLTVEIEHLDTATLAALTETPMYPAPSVVALIQDKLRQKETLQAAGLAVAPFGAGTEPDTFPVILKARFNAYDGRGNVTVNTAAELPGAIERLGGRESDLYFERIVPFARELTVMVARGIDGAIRSYPPVQTFHREHILHAVYAPAPHANGAIELAERAVRLLDTAGIFGVELFGLADGGFLINEIAPRPHNAGHFSIEACHTSQFEQHVRAVMGLPLGDPSMSVAAAVMINLLGDESGGTIPSFDAALKLDGASAHWYGKRASRPRRKMAHVTIVGTRAEVVATARALTDLPLESIAPPAVGIIMGSDSDLPTMRAAAETLRALGIAYEMTIVSAHRTPDRMVAYAHTAADRGLQVIIAGAGGAAHLPGMVAAMTTLPVIGVPVRTEALSGVDSLYSIVQMPRGVPVATVAIGNAVNAGLLAARILGASDPAMRARLEHYRAEMERGALDKAAALEDSDESTWRG